MSEIKQLLNMTYDECCNYLINKYGHVLGDYFLNENCKSTNTKIKRTKEGLYIHHMDEDKAIMLSTKEIARLNPFDYQKANRLVYCNLLEHLVLHIKIVEFPNPNKNKNEDVGIGGIINFLIPELNAIYSGIKYYGMHKWKNIVIEKIINLKDDYLVCIKKIFELGINDTYPLFTCLKSFPIQKCVSLFKEMREIGIKK